MSDEVERRLITVLDSYATSPFGNPIPGLLTLLDEEPNKEQLLKDAEKDARPEFVRAADLESTEPVKATVLSINEIVQVEHKIMAKLSAVQIVPGAEVTIELTDDGITLTGEHGEISIPDELAHAICVSVSG